MFILKLKENIIAIIIILLTLVSMGIVNVIEISASSYSLLSSGITLDEDVPPKINLQLKSIIFILLNQTQKCIDSIIYSQMI